MKFPILTNHRRSLLRRLLCFVALFLWLASVSLAADTAATGVALVNTGTLAVRTNGTAALGSSDRQTVAIGTITADGHCEVDAGTGRVTIGSISGGNPSVLSGSASGTVGVFTGGSLYIRGGDWRLTGDNTGRSGSVVIFGGSFGVAPGATLGSRDVQVRGGTLRLAKGATLDTRVPFSSGTLSMLDGEIGTYTIQKLFSTPPNTLVFQFDIGPAGADEIILNTVGNTNDFRDLVSLNIIGKIKPGTYLIARQMDGDITENHFGFGFTGDPADHGNIVKTMTQEGYRFTLDTANSAGGGQGYGAHGNYNEYTLTVEEIGTPVPAH